MKVILGGLLALLISVDAYAAGNCVDALVPQGQAGVYTCTGSNNGGANVSRGPVLVEPIIGSSNVFRLTLLDTSQEVTCYCNPSGSPSNTTAFANKRFSCSGKGTSGFNYTISVNGTTNGKGTKILNFLAQNTQGEFFYSKCIRELP